MTDDIAFDPNADQEERLKAWSREKEGLVRDLQSEREKRQGLETRLSSLESRLRPTDEPEPVESKVNRLASNPDKYIEDRVKPDIEKLNEKLGQVQLSMVINEAYDWLADQEGTTRRKILNSDLDKDIARIVKDQGLSKLDPITGTQAAYKILQQERKEKQDSERARTAAINGNSTERSRASVASSGGTFTQSQIAAMDREEYERNRPAILEASRKGLISQK